MTLRGFIDLCLRRLEPLYPATEAKAIALRLLDHYLEIPSYKVYSEPEATISAAGDGEDRLYAALDDLATGRPLQYVLGFTEFCGHRFKVREGCLIPRPETEELVGRIIDDLTGTEIGDEPFNILDIGTGSGCIAWSLAAAFPEAMVYGCDRSDDALKIACKQRVRLHGPKPLFFWADVLAALMQSNVLDFEPEEALFVPDDEPLVYYQAIARWASALLRPDGRIYLEVNERFGPQTAALFPGSQVLQDVSGKDRFVIR